MSYFVKYILFGLSLLLLSGCGGSQPDLQTDRYLVGAHYYSWYPRNWSLGCLRRALRPAQSPMLGYYDSQDIDVLEQQIAWCSQYGIDFLALDWWPSRDSQSEHLKDVFLKASNINDIKFCIHYETHALNFDKNIGATVFTEEVSERFVNDILGLADDFFNHPSYLHVDGRPVVALYLTRTLSGDYRGAIRKLRRELKRRGHDIFLIGDEIFWKVTPVVEKGEMPHPLVEEPQIKRAGCFDALMGYNMYENEIKSQAGYGAESTFISDVSAKFDEYKAALGDSVYYVPGVIPGYNDRGGRRKLAHYAIPRRWSSTDEEGSFFDRSIDLLAKPYIDERLNMFLITSLNEWNEDTAIEPMIESAATSKGADTSADFYTQGYQYTGHGMRYMEILRDQVVAVYGRLLDAEDEPLQGVAIEAMQGDITVSAVSDTRGYWRISRLNLVPGKCEIHINGKTHVIVIEKGVAVELR